MDVNVKETGRVVEIKDQRDNLRYKVMMLVNDEVDQVTLSVIRSYTIRVVSFYGLDNPLCIYNQKIDKYDDAEVSFEEQKKNYTLLVKTETRPISDIALYNEKVDYKETQPECCFFCKFAYMNMKHKLECHNPKNFECYLDLTDNGLKNDFRRDLPPHHHPVVVFPLPEKPRDCNMKKHHCDHHEHICPHPEVGIFGCCKNFKSKLPADIEELFNFVLRGCK